MKRSVDDWLGVVYAEYLEMPGLNLTRPQARRLWSLDAPTCDAVLDALEAACVLKRTPDDAYVLACDEQIPMTALSESGSPSSR